MKKFLTLVSVFVFTFLCAGLSRAEAQEPEQDATDEEATEAVDIPARPPPWTGRFDLGYTWQSGRADKSELSLRAQADREVAPNQYRALAEFLYGELEGVRNTQRFMSSFRWRHDVSERVFTQTLTLYESDRVRDIRNRVEQNVGVGYRYVDSDRLKGTVVPGFTVQYTDEEGVDDRWSYLASLSQDLIWTINEAYRFEEDLHFLIDPADTEDYIVRFNAGIVGTLTRSINLSVRYQLLYENDVRPDVEKTDQRVIASVGYSF